MKAASLRRAIVLVSLGLPALQAREGCTERDLAGSFGFFAKGQVIQSPVTSLAGPFARVGRFDADGAGRLRFSSTATFNGVLIPQDFAGTYVMESDCTFTAKVFLPEPFNLNVTFLGTVAESGNEVREFFLDPPGVVIHGTRRKIGFAGCTNRSLSGSYQIEMSGSIIEAPANKRIPFAAMGKIDADGNGKFAGKLGSNFGGLAGQEQELVSGTYAVAPDCTFVLKYYTEGEDTGPGNGVTLKGVVFDKGDGAYLLVVDPANATVLGNMKLQ